MFRKMWEKFERIKRRERKRERGIKREKERKKQTNDWERELVRKKIGERKRENRGKTCFFSTNSQSQYSRLPHLHHFPRNFPYSNSFRSSMIKNSSSSTSNCNKQKGQYCRKFSAPPHQLLDRLNVYHIMNKNLQSSVHFIIQSCLSNNHTSIFFFTLFPVSFC